MKRKAMVVLLICSMLAPLLRYGQGQVEAATDQYGFSTEIPEDFNPTDGKNPYGNGYTALNPIMEPLIFQSSSGSMSMDYWNNGNPKNGVRSGDEVSMVSKSSQCEADFVSTKAYDPTGQGHDYMVAMVGLKNGNVVVWNYDTRTKSQGSDYVVTMSGHDRDWFGSIDQWEYTGFFTLTSGDFDGDGDDEIAVYVPQRGGPYVRILTDTGSGSFAQVGRDIRYDEFMEGANISGKFENNGRTERAMVQASLDAADLDRDGKDELIMLGSFANLHENSDTKEIKKRSSSLAIYKQDESFDMHKQSDFKLNDEKTSVYMRSASCSAGDIDYDGFPEIVAAGYFTSDDYSDSLDGDEFAITSIDYDPDTRAFSMGNVRKVEMNGFVDDGFYTSDTIQAPPALICAAVNGRNDREHVFLEGTMYVYDDDWTEEYTAEKYTKSHNGIDGYIISNTWVESAVAGNFDGNALGIEQIYYTCGYKQMSLYYYFYNVNVIGKPTVDGEDGTKYAGDYYASLWQYVKYHKSSGANLFVALAAIDPDDDTDTMVYSRKEYTYSNVEVLAILQAAPYFEDLMDDYPDAVGNTSFEKVEGSGGSSSTTKTVSAGAYMSFEKSIIPFVLNFTTEISYSHEWQWEYEKEKTIEYGVNFEGGFMEDSVVLYRTPMTLYYYDVYPAGGGSPYSMSVGIQDRPVYSVLELNEYNALAEKDEAMKSKVISDGVLGSIPGQPSSYKSNAAGLKDFTGAKEFISCSAGATTAVTTQSITVGEQNSASQSYTNSIETKIGLSGGSEGHFGVAGGASVGGSWGGGTTTFEYKDVTKSGSVASPSKTEYPYSFQWKFGTWRATVGKTEVPVLGYLVKNVQEPPSLPENIAVDTVTRDSITLGWGHGFRKPLYYEVYQYFEDSVADSGYSLIATLDGDETSFTYEDLEPNSEYTFALRAVGQDENGNRIGSEYSALVTGVTLKDGLAPTIHGMSDDVSVCAGDTAAFTVDATPSSGATAGLTYSWQVRKADTVIWTGIAGSLSTLTLQDVTEDMDGNRYRCVVSEIQNGARMYSYSESRMLNVGKADSSVAVTAKNGTKNTGNADYKVETAQKQTSTEIKTVTVTVPVTIDAEGNEKKESVTETYQVFANTLENTDDLKYVYRSQRDGSFYVLENLTDSSDGDGQTAAKRVLLSTQDGYFAESEDGTGPVEGLRPDNLTGTEQQIYEYGDQTPQEEEPEPGEISAEGNYLCWTAASADDTGEYLNLYSKEDDTSAFPQLYQVVDGVMQEWSDDGGEWTDDGTYLTPKAVYSLEPGSETIGDAEYEVWQDFDDPERKLYQKTDEGSIHYYQKEANAQEDEPEFIMKEIYLIQPETLTDSGKQYSVLPKEAAETIIKEEEKVVYEARSGDEVTLLADVAALSEGKSVDGKVTFQILNNRTGEITTLSADVAGTERATASVTWTPVTAGDYTITAAFGGNEFLNPSSGTASYYAADGPQSSVGYVLEGSSNVIYGDRVDLQIQKAETDATGNISLHALARGTSVTYRMQYMENGEVKEETLGGNEFGVSYEPEKPGTYTFIASVADSEAALRVVNVLKRPITITAPSQKGISSTDTDGKIPKVQDVTAVYTGDEEKRAILERDQGVFDFNDIFEITARPELTKESGANDYITGLVYKTVDGGSEADDGAAAYTELVQQFLDKYNVTLNTGLYNIVAGVRSVEYTAGANGTLRAYYGDNQTAFASGTSITEGTKLTFVADADINFQVKNWLVTDGEGKKLEEGEDYSLSGSRLFLSSLKKDLKVEVTFEPASHSLTFTAGDNGSICAQYIKEGEGNGSALTSPETVAAGKDVQITAVPEEGYVVKQWIVTEGGKTAEIRRNTDGSVYSYSTLDLKDIHEDLRVQVEFEPEAFYTVKTCAVDEEGNAVPGCEIAVDGVDQNGRAKKGTQLTFTAELPDTNIVQEWRIYDDDKNYTVVSGNADTYTVFNAQKDLQVEILVSEMKTYQLHFDVVDEENRSVEAENILTAGWKGTSLSSGTDYTAYIPIDFATKLPENYQIAKWTLRQGSSGNRETVAEGKDAREWRLESLSEETWVTVHVEGRPTLTYEAKTDKAANTVTCEEIDSGGYLDKYRTDAIALLVSPERGYEIDTVTVSHGEAEESDRTEGDSDRVLGGSADGKIAYQTERVKGSSDSRLILTPKEEGITKDVHVTVTFKEIKPVTDVEYSLYNSGDGVHGSMNVSVDRNGAQEYKQSTEDAKESGMVSDIYRDSVVTLTVNPDNGYRTARWFVNGEEVTDGISKGTTEKDTFTYTITADDAAPVQIMAQMEQIGNKLTFGGKSVLDETKPGGTVTAVNNLTGRPSYSGNMLTADADMTFTAHAADGYELVGWEVDGERISGETNDTFTYRILAYSVTDVRAVFDRAAHTVLWNAKDGTVTAVNTTDGGTVKRGDKVRGGRELAFTAKPDAGMKLVGWQVNAASVPEDQQTSNPLILTLEEDVEITALFGQEPNCTVTYGVKDVLDKEDEGGTLTAALDSAQFQSGEKGAKNDKILFTAAPEENYRVKTWIVDGRDTKTSEESYTLIVSESSHNVTVIYEKIKGTVLFGSNDASMGTLAVRAGDAGKETDITPGETVPSYSKVTFTAAPEEGYLVEGWYLNEAMTERIEGTEYEQNIYSIDSLYGDSRVYVKFEEVPSYEITIGMEGTGKGSLAVTLNGSAVTDMEDGVLKAPRHSKVTVTAKPRDEYSFLSAWNGETAGSDTYTIQDVTKAEKIIAEFSPAELVEVRFDVPKEMENECDPTVTNGYGDNVDAYDRIEAVGKTVQVLSGSWIRFAVTPPKGKMVDAWTVTYYDGTVISGEELGVDDSLLLWALDRNVAVSVSFADILAWKIPEEKIYTSDEGEEVYRIENLVRRPDTLPKESEYEDKVRHQGEISFNVVPGKGKWVTGIRLADTSEDSGVISCTRNEDESWTVTIQEIRGDLSLQVDTVNYYTVSIKNAENGSITARDEENRVITDGQSVAEGTNIIFTATPDKHYRFAKWGGDAAENTDPGKSLPNEGEAVNTTISDIQKDISVSAEFAMTEHDNTEVRDTKAATCTDSGYTGDVYCTDCGALVTKGKATEALGHSYTSAVTKKATTQKSGLRTFTCSRCGYQYTEKIAALPKPIIAKPIKAGKNANRISWNKVSGADGYIVWGDMCATKTRKNHTVKKVKKVLSAKRTTWTHKNLKKATWYKYQIKAFKIVDGKRVILSQTPVIHAITAGSSQYGNPVKVKVNMTKVSVKKGKTKRIKASAVLPKKRKYELHCEEIRYIAVDKTIATVTKKGVIKAKAKGKTTVYAIAQNGVSKKITVTVK